MADQAAGRETRPTAVLVRCTPTLPALLGGVVAVSAVSARVITGGDLSAMYALAVVGSTAGLGFALDDPAGEIIAPSPTTLARRRLYRIVVA